MLYIFQYGRTALEAVMKSVLQIETPLVPVPGEYQGHFLNGNYLLLSLSIYYYHLLLVLGEYYFVTDRLKYLRHE